jgi:hypothetical protein
MAQLFGDERCTAAILEFLATTKVGVRVRGRVDRPNGKAEDDEAEDDDAEDDEAEDVEAVFDPGGRAVERVMWRVKCRRGRVGKCWQGGDGGGWAAVPRQGRGVEARAAVVSFLLFFVFVCVFVFVLMGESGQASPAGHGQEAVIRCTYAMAAKRPYAIWRNKQTKWLAGFSKDPIGWRSPSHHRYGFVRRAGQLIGTKEQQLVFVLRYRHIHEVTGRWCLLKERDKLE